MSKLRQLSMAIMLTLVLATGAFAGIIGGGPEPPPEPPPATATGIIDTPPSAQPEPSATDPVVEIVLDLMQSALLLF